MAITREEAIEKATQLNPEVNRAVEYKDAYVFYKKTKVVQFGGNSAFAIMKDDGKAVNLSAYIMGTKHYNHPKRIPMKKNWLQVWLSQLLHTMRRSAGEL